MADTLSDDWSARRPAHPAGRWAALWGRLSESFLTERDRWPLWFPVWFGLGIGLYFGLPIEPPLWPSLVVTLLALLLLILGWRSGWPRVPLVPLMLIAAGFTAGCWRTIDMAGPILEARMGPAWVTGRVVNTAATAQGRRVLIEAARIEGLALTATPQRIRLSFRTAHIQPIPEIGQQIRVRAMLQPPMPPTAPGAFDLQRFLYFAGVGATGSALGAAAILADAQGGASSWSQGLAQLRRTITQRVLAALPGDVGAVAAALIAGDESEISPGMNRAMRDSGLAHLLSISGLHMAIVAGFVLFLVRALLACSEHLTLHYPIKKWAAVAALVAVGFYALLAGWTVPTQRSFYSSALVLLALLIDRSAISLRVVAWAALLVLVAAPEAVLNPSFQMSFGAVAALIAGYEIIRRPIGAWQARGGWWRIALLYVAGLIFSSMIATFATSPFSAYHFNRIALYGVIANMIAVPISGVLVMPAALIAVLLMPFHLEWLALVPMGWGIALINWTAEAIASLPGAVMKVPAFPISALVIFTLGGLWLCLWRSAWRWWGLVPIGFSLVVAATALPPTILVAADGRLMALHPPDGKLSFGDLGQKTPPKFMADAWLARYAEDADEPGPADSEKAGRCDTLGCTYRLDGLKIAWVRDARGLADDCREADIVISTVPVRGRCPTPALVIDRFDLWRGGAHAVWISGREIHAASVRDTRGVRPWAPEPKSRAQRLSTSAAGTPAAPAP